MDRVDIIKGLNELTREFTRYDSIECKYEDAELLSCAVRELSKNDAEMIDSLRLSNKERKKEIDLLKKENQELSKELELYKWAFEGLKSVYFESVKTGEENGY